MSTNYVESLSLDHAAGMHSKVRVVGCPKCVRDTAAPIASRKEWQPAPPKQPGAFPLPIITTTLAFPSGGSTQLTVGSLAAVLHTLQNMLGADERTPVDIELNEQGFSVTLRMEP